MVPVYDQSLLLLVDAVCTYVCVYVCDLTCKFVHMIFMNFHETFYEDLKVVLKKLWSLQIMSQEEINELELKRALLRLC